MHWTEVGDDADRCGMEIDQEHVAACSHFDRYSSMSHVAASSDADQPATPYPNPYSEWSRKFLREFGVMIQEDQSFRRFMFVGLLSIEYAVHHKTSFLMRCNGRNGRQDTRVLNEDST